MGMTECSIGKAFSAIKDLAQPKPSRREARRDAIMTAGARLFVEKGYGATSLNDVVRLSGGSLSTLYDMFGSKAGLFRAIVTQRCEMMTGAFENPEIYSHPIAEALSDLGMRFMSVLTADDTVAVMRSVSSEALQFPELAQVFYEAGPLRGRARVAGYLEEQARRGILMLDNAEEAAMDFCQLIIRDAQMNAMMGLPYPKTPDAIQRHVNRAVACFLRAYGTAVQTQADPALSGLLPRVPTGR
jgi:TetR/AcrR family transcriptional regulator, mexJK operon transcriptional repressor